MKELVTTLWQKAYMLEFEEDAFTFSVPPESEELSYAQRKTETKTFGGLHIDDYGIDVVKIVLSGSTINQSLKKIYGAGKADKKLSGEDEILYLRELLIKYKNSAENINKPIYLYDLSKTGKKGNSWQVAIGDFKIRRSNDRPFTYKYSIEFTGWDTNKTQNVAANSSIISISDATPIITTPQAGAPITTQQRQEVLLEKIGDVIQTNDHALEAVEEVLSIIKSGELVSEDKITALQEAVEEARKKQETLRTAKTNAENANRGTENIKCENCPQKEICGQK
jgi:hypothetical protein